MEDVKKEVEELRAAAKAARALAAEKDAAADAIVSKIAEEDTNATKKLLAKIDHSLVCPFCGITLTNPPSFTFNHLGCYNTGCWVRGFKNYNDWIRACVENGADIQAFYKRAKEERF
jgi:hypothetical protein